MKLLKIFAAMFIAGAMTFAISACSDDDDPVSPTVAESISASPASLNFDVEGEALTVSVTATGAWTASCALDWVSVSPESGSGNATVTVTAESNYSEDGSETRTGSLTFTLTSGEGSATVTVSQDGADNGDDSGEGSGNDGDDSGEGSGNDGDDSGEGSGGGETPSDGVYFYDDLDWLIPYAEAANQVDCVGNNNQKGYVQGDARLDKVKVDGVSAMDELHSRGYLIEKYDGVLSTSGSNVYTFAMPGYIYFGNSSTPIGLHLPTISNVPSDSSPLMMTFNWCPGMNDGSGYAVDTVALTVVFTTGSEVVALDCPGHSFTDDGYFDWLDISLDLAENGVTITADTDIFIHPQTAYWTEDQNRHRWYIDNIKIFNPDEAE